MDCGSFSEEIIRMTHCYCNKFYIRAGKSQSLYENMTKITEWDKVEINFGNYEVVSIPFTSFPEENSYRLVIQRQKRKDNEPDLFDDLQPGSRVKRFIFRFITVPAKWIKTGRQWILNIYSDKPYKQLWSP